MRNHPQSSEVGWAMSLTGPCGPARAPRTPPHRPGRAEAARARPAPAQHAYARSKRSWYAHAYTLALKTRAHGWLISSACSSLGPQLASPLAGSQPLCHATPYMSGAGVQAGMLQLRLIHLPNCTSTCLSLSTLAALFGFPLLLADPHRPAGY